MKVKEVIGKLKKLVKEHPEYADLPAVYSIDDEGNEFHELYYTATPAKFADFKEHHLEREDMEDGDVPNAIIIN